MPSKSEAQQRFMGMALAAKRGKGHFSKKVMEAAKSMSEKQLRDFAKTKHEGLPEKKAYIEGFMSRAREYGYTPTQCYEAVKLASFAYGDLTTDKYSPGGILAITQEHEPGVLNHLKRNAGKYVGGLAGLTAAGLMNYEHDGYAPGSVTAAIAPFTIGSIVDDIVERKSIEEKIKDPEALKQLRRFLNERESLLEQKTAAVLDKIKNYLKKENKEDDKNMLEKIKEE